MAFHALFSGFLGVTNHSEREQWAAQSWPDHRTRRLRFVEWTAMHGENPDQPSLIVCRGCQDIRHCEAVAYGVPLNRPAIWAIRSPEFSKSLTRPK